MRRIARSGWRQIVVLVAMLFTFSVLAQSLIRLQVQQANSAQLQTYYAQDVAAPSTQRPPRGIVLDANGTPLVGTVTVYKLAAAPPYVTDKENTARALASVLFPIQAPTDAAPEKALYAQHVAAILHALERPYSYYCLAGDDSPYCVVKHNISQAAAEQIDAMNLPGKPRGTGLPGITLEPRSQPSYPNGGLAAQVLGYVTYKYVTSGQNSAGQWVDSGQYGVQQYYDSLLKGIPGHVAVRTDTSGNAIRVGTGSDAAPQAGATLRLTIDSYVQYLVEQKLQQVVTKFGAASGTVIVERPSDGAILAMASTPSYNPNNWHQLVNSSSNGFSAFLNPAISQQYEPGSTFKALTTAIGLDSKSFRATDYVDDLGTYTTDGITIRNWCLDSCSFGGWEDPSIMLHYSSNIGAARFGQRIPTSTWYDYLSRFGFGQPTGIDLTGEIAGSVPNPTAQHAAVPWYQAFKDTQAYGQGIAVTPLQLANAYAALANGGWILRPHVLQSYTLGGKTMTVSAQRARQAVSADTAQQMLDMLVHSSINGEACNALVPGYDIGAKTGTASIPQYRTYAANQTIASTAAIAPAENPRFVVLVVLNKPNVQWGSLTAAPAVHDILQQLFEYYKIPPPAYPVQPLTKCPYPAST